MADQLDEAEQGLNNQNQSIVSNVDMQNEAEGADEIILCASREHVTKVQWLHHPTTITCHLLHLNRLLIVLSLRLCSLQTVAQATL